MVEKRKEKFYIIALNLLKERHGELIEWIKEEAKKEDRSLSSFCINAVREYRKQKEKEDNGK
jgi:hypothetical protein